MNESYIKISNELLIPICEKVLEKIEKMESEKAQYAIKKECAARNNEQSNWLIRLFKKPKTWTLENTLEDLKQESLQLMFPDPYYNQFFSRPKKYDAYNIAQGLLTACQYSEEINISIKELVKLDAWLDKEE